MKIFNCALQRKGTFNLVPSKYKCCCNQSTGSSENGNKRRIKELLVEKSSLGKSAEKKASFVAGGQTEISQSQSGRKRKISGPSSYPGIYVNTLLILTILLSPASVLWCMSKGWGVFSGYRLEAPFPTLRRVYRLILSSEKIDLSD